MGREIGLGREKRKRERKVRHLRRWALPTSIFTAMYGQNPSFYARKASSYYYHPERESFKGWEFYVWGNR